jgi:hypothetical protein
MAAEDFFALGKFVSIHARDIFESSETLMNTAFAAMRKIFVMILSVVCMKCFESNACPDSESNPHWPLKM